VPVTGLSRDEVAELLAYSKVYVDFGAHAGRTRLPREALAAGCVVVTGRRGAAGNGVDLALPEGFAFDESESTVLTVLDRIALAVMDFPESSLAFITATEAVRAEREQLAAQVASRTASWDILAPDARLASAAG
jgi:hypothetical protein